jgi:hypothetical protein
LKARTREYWKRLSCVSAAGERYPHRAEAAIALSVPETEAEDSAPIGDLEALLFRFLVSPQRDLRMAGEFL